MSPSTSSATEIVRRTFLKIESDAVLQAVDSLDLRGSGRVSAVIGVPLRNLQQRRDVAAFASSAPVAAMRALLELLAMAPLEKLVEALGDHSENPSHDQLAAAVDQLLGSEITADEVIEVLAFAIIEGFPAAPHCRRLLAERPEFELPALPEVVVTSTLVSPKETDPLVREQRRARREEEKKRKKGPSSVRPPRPVKAKTTERSSVSRAVATRNEGSPGALNERRRIVLTPIELERFDPDHPLAGTVVLVDVPFDAVDPDVPEIKSKERPALVVAACTDGLLIRAIYSNPSPTRSTFQAWRRLGFDHLSYVDGTRIALTGVTPESFKRLGRLNDQEWNAQL